MAGKTAPPNYESDMMPAYTGILSDEEITAGHALF